MAKLLGCLFLAAGAAARRSEVLREEQEKMGVVWRGNSSNSHEELTLGDAAVPPAFNWCNFDGEGKNSRSYCTKSLNQHIPQYCGSCWAHGAVSALADRIKIARHATGADVNPSVQHILNCGNVGSCHGGSVDGPYQWIHEISRTGAGISYDTANPYMACSSESEQGFCPEADWTCTPANIARTCGSFDKEEGPCAGLDSYPNATISEYGSISGKAAMQKEILLRGPITCGIDAGPLLKYEKGIISDEGEGVDHVISVVGWGHDDAKDQTYWWVRNSWGEFWGEMGYVKVAEGALMVEEQCAWAVPGSFTAYELDNQATHCWEGGDNCKGQKQVAV